MSGFLLVILIAVRKALWWSDRIITFTSERSEIRQKYEGAVVEVPIDEVIYTMHGDP